MIKIRQCILNEIYYLENAEMRNGDADSKIPAVSGIQNW
jgi:hypothetical protein